MSDFKNSWKSGKRFARAIAVVELAEPFEFAEPGGGGLGTPVSLLRGVGLGKALVHDQRRLATLLAGSFAHGGILLAIAKMHHT